MQSLQADRKNENYYIKSHGGNSLPQKHNRITHSILKLTKWNAVCENGVQYRENTRKLLHLPVEKLPLQKILQLKNSHIKKISQLKNTCFKKSPTLEAPEDEDLEGEGVNWLPRHKGWLGDRYGSTQRFQNQEAEGEGEILAGGAGGVGGAAVGESGEEG